MSKEPVFILIEPQLGENIGTAARAMYNCGLTQLRIVRPREQWPNPKAKAAAAGAHNILKNIKVFSSTIDAISDLQQIFATTARTRHTIKPLFTARSASKILAQHTLQHIQSGILFGCERSGLNNDDLLFADSIITIPLHLYNSLNLAQAVLLIAYEYFTTLHTSTQYSLPTHKTAPAQRQQLLNLFQHLEDVLDNTQYFPTTQQRKVMIRNLRNIIYRMSLTEKEVQTFHGVLCALAGPWHKKKSS